MPQTQIDKGEEVIRLTWRRARKERGRRGKDAEKETKKRMDRGEGPFGCCWTSFALHQVFQVLLKYMYTDMIPSKMDPNLAGELLVIANQYNLTRLR